MKIKIIKKQITISFYLWIVSNDLIFNLVHGRSVLSSGISSVISISSRCWSELDGTCEGQVLRVDLPLV